MGEEQKIWFVFSSHHLIPLMLSAWNTTHTHKHTMLWFCKAWSWTQVCCLLRCLLSTSCVRSHDLSLTDLSTPTEFTNRCEPFHPIPVTMETGIMVCSASSPAASSSHYLYRTTLRTRLCLQPQPILPRKNL